MLDIVGNQAVAIYKARVGRRIQSAPLQADAKHAWLDALSSLGALLGLVIVATGRWGDPIAGFVVTVFIIQVGFTVTREILPHLKDGVDPADSQAARDAALAVGGDLIDKAVDRRPRCYHWGGVSRYRAA